MRPYFIIQFYKNKNKSKKSCGTLHWHTFAYNVAHILGNHGDFFTI